MKKIISILVCALLVVSMFAGCTKKSQFEGLASKYQALQNGDFSKLESMAPKAFWEKHDVDVDDLIESRTEDFEDNTSESKEDTYGKNWKVTVSVEDELKLEKDELEDLAETLENAADVDEKDVTAAYHLWLYVKTEGDDDRDHSIEKYYAVKISNTWYLYGDYGFCLN